MQEIFEKYILKTLTKNQDKLREYWYNNDSIQTRHLIIDDLLPSITTNPSNCKTGVTTGVSFENITGTGVGATGSIGHPTAMW